MSVLILQGSNNEKQQLQDIMQLVLSVPKGQQLLANLEKKGRPVILCFSKDTDGWGGMFEGRENRVKIRPPRPTDFYYGSPECIKRLSRAVVHELRHALMENLDGTTKHNSSSMKEYILADLLSEADAYLFQKDFWDELNGQTQMSKSMRTQEVQKALLGQNELAKKYIERDVAKYHRWIQEARKWGVSSDDEKTLHNAIMKHTPVASKFHDGVAKWLKSMDVALSAKEVMALDIPLSAQDKNNLFIPPQRGGME